MRESLNIADRRRPHNATGRVTAVLRPLHCRMPSEDLARWDDLERRSLLANPFLSSTFVNSQPWPRLRESDLQLLTVEHGDEWLAAGVFRRVNGSRDLPLPHLVALPLLHVYKTGLLVDAAQGRLAVQVLWDFLSQAGWHGLKFPLFPVSSPLSLLLGNICDQRQLRIAAHNEYQRAIVLGHQASADSGVSTARLKSLSRGRRALEKLGEVRLRFNNSQHDAEQAIERFLSLESLACQGRPKEALLANPLDVDSFRTYAAAFVRQDRIVFAELCAGESVIASMCLFRSATDYYAFKVGWNPEHVRGSPGFLLGHLIRRHIANLPGCERLDGCARPGSFLEHVWDARKIVGDVIFPTTRWGSIAAQGSLLSRLAWRCIRSLRVNPTSGTSCIGGDPA